MERAGAVVIGGGIAGVSAAHHLATRTDVVLLEAHPTLAHHTTGRSAAMYLENYGTDAVRHLTLASKPFLEQPPAGTTDAPLLEPRGMLSAGGPDQVAALEALAERGRSLVESIRFVDGAEAVAICPLLRLEWVAAAVWEPDARSMDVGALHQAFVRGLRAANGRIITDAPVRSLVRGDDGWHVEAGEHRVVAGLVVNAAGAWADEMATMAGLRPVGLRPLRRTAFTVAAPDGLDVAALPLVHAADDSFYVKPEGPQLLCSPADETPSEPCDAKPEELDVARAIDAIGAATTLAIRSVRRSWAGLRTFAPDREPVLGPDPDDETFVWCAGQGGTGIQTAPAAGALTAALALGVGDGELADGTTVDLTTVLPDRLR
ncbi:MAG: FAD-binding oxidoreductase [Actinomycetota bacterium]|nr:FAD-binding oxidoreductase [Actinomycetota bacterium]